MSLDIAVFQWFNSWAGISPYVNWFVFFAAQYLLYWMIAGFFVFPILPIFLKFRESLGKNLELFIFGLASSLLARYGVTELIRFFYDRPRPFEIYDNIVLLANHASVASFPSGHAVFSFALATAVFLYYRKAGVLFFLAALFVGVARIVAGVHWPSDILGGAVIGIVFVFIAYFLLRKVKRTAWAVQLLE